MHDCPPPSHNFSHIQQLKFMKNYNKILVLFIHTTLHCTNHHYFIGSFYRTVSKHEIHLEGAPSKLPKILFNPQAGIHICFFSPLFFKCGQQIWMLDYIYSLSHYQTVRCNWTRKVFHKNHLVWCILNCFW